MFDFFVFYTCVSNLLKQLQNWIRQITAFVSVFTVLFKGCACRRGGDHIYIYIYIYIHAFVGSGGVWKHR